jgi:MinD superfamily P-loop ATPase
VRFDPAHPEQIIEDVFAATRPAASGVVVTGVSGGVGATSVATHLAASLGRRSNTCLVDLDPRGGLRTRLGMPLDALTWADVGADDESLRQAALPIAPGLRAYVAPRSADLDPSALLRRVLENFHHVVIDAPLDVLETALQVVSAGVLIAAPTFRAMERAGEVLVRHPIRWAVVTNRLGPGGEATKPELERVLGRTIGLELPCAPRLRDAEDDRRMLDAWSRWARRIDRLADVLEDQ